MTQEMRRQCPVMMETSAAEVAGPGDQIKRETETDEGEEEEEVEEEVETQEVQTSNVCLSSIDL